MENIERKTEWLFSRRCSQETTSLRGEWWLCNLFPAFVCFSFTGGWEVGALFFSFYIIFFREGKKFFSFFITFSSFFIISPASGIAPQGFCQDFGEAKAICFCRSVSFFQLNYLINLSICLYFGQKRVLVSFGIRLVYKSSERPKETAETNPQTTEARN